MFLLLLIVIVVVICFPTIALIVGLLGATAALWLAPAALALVILHRPLIWLVRLFGEWWDNRGRAEWEKDYRTQERARILAELAEIDRRYQDDPEMREFCRAQVNGAPEAQTYFYDWRAKKRAAASL